MPVPATLEGERIDSAVALITGWSRADVQALLARDAIVVDGKPVGKSHRLVTGSVIEILEEPAVTASPAGDRERAPSTFATPTTTWSCSRSRQAWSCTPAPAIPTGRS